MMHYSSRSLCSQLLVAYTGINCPHICSEHTSERCLDLCRSFTAIRQRCLSLSLFSTWRPMVTRWACILCWYAVMHLLSNSIFQIITSTALYQSFVNKTKRLTRTDYVCDLYEICTHNGIRRPLYTLSDVWFHLTFIKPYSALTV